MPRSAKDIAEIARLAQLTIDAPYLEKYFHSDKPGRSPLCVRLNTFITKDVSLVKFGHPVRFVKAADAKAKRLPCFEFSSIEVHPETATVKFSYSPEGIAGTTSFRKTNSQWEIVDHQLVER